MPREHRKAGFLKKYSFRANSMVNQKSGNTLDDTTSKSVTTSFRLAWYLWLPLTLMPLHTSFSSQMIALFNVLASWLLGSCPWEIVQISAIILSLPAKTPPSNSPILPAGYFSKQEGRGGLMAFTWWDCPSHSLIISNRGWIRQLDDLKTLKVVSEQIRQWPWKGVEWAPIVGLHLTLLLFAVQMKVSAAIQSHSQNWV